MLVLPCTCSMSCTGPRPAAPSASTQTTDLQCPQNHRSPDRLLAERPKEGIEGKGLCKPSGVTQSSQAKLQSGKKVEIREDSLSFSSSWEIH